MDLLEELKKYYENEGLEDLRLRADGQQHLEFMTAVKYIERYIAPGSKILDSCAGSGIYSFYLAGKGHTVTAGDIVPFNVEIIREKQQANPVLHDVYLGDARKLPQFAGGSFDAVLCMGALYHLLEEGGRSEVISESLRLIKEGGLFVFTYLNRYAVILNDSRGDLDNIDEILKFAHEGREGIFYASHPAEMENMFESFGIEKLCHVALDGMVNFMHDTAKLINDVGIKKWQKYHFEVCEEYSLLGSSYHNMFIGRKKT